jgi:hypothetical protein
MTTEINKTTGHGHTAKMDANEGLTNRILNKTPEGKGK